MTNHHSVNLKIEKGTLVGIVGQVGSGKSTLLSAMLGEAERLNGSVTVDVSGIYFYNYFPV